MIKLISFGDFILADAYENFYENKINPFLELNEIFQGCDYSIGNLESFCESDEGENHLKRPRFKVKSATFQLLRHINPNLLSVASNHCFDNLKSGFINTVNILDNEKINYVGADIQENSLLECKLINIKNKKFVFLNYLHQFTNPAITKDSGLFIRFYNREVIINDLLKCKNSADYMVLLLHWGIDNSYYPAPWQREDARAFIDAGADLIVGHHTHTIQGFEIYKNKRIYYSLGNFCASDFYFEGNLIEIDRNKHMESFILDVGFTESGLEFQHHFTRNENGIIKLSENSTTEYRFRRRCRFIPVISRPILWQIYLFNELVLYKVYFYFFGNNRNPWKRLAEIKFSKLKKLYLSLKSVFTK